MYVISLVTEFDVVKGGRYKVVRKHALTGNLTVLDDIEEEFQLTPEEYIAIQDTPYMEAYLEYHNKTEWVQETGTAKEWGKHRADILRERIEALQEENAELKFRLDSLEK